MQISAHGSCSKKPQTAIAGDALMVVHMKDSIWCYKHDENKMVEYCLKSNATKRTVQYTTDHTVCTFNQMIYLIDGEHGKIIEFDPLSAQFTTKQSRLHNIGKLPSVIAANDGIYIYTVEDNYKSWRYFYNPSLNAIKRMEVFESNERVTVNYRNKMNILLNWLVRININHITRIISHFERTNNCAECELPSELIAIIFKFYDNSHSQQYGWRESVKAFGFGFGYVLYNHYLIILGGCVMYHYYIDNIFILDLNNIDKGWVKSEIKCPHKSAYKAILTSNNDIHLFAIENYRTHYSIPISLIIK